MNLNIKRWQLILAIVILLMAGATLPALAGKLSGVLVGTVQYHDVYASVDVSSVVVDYVPADRSHPLTITMSCDGNGTIHPVCTLSASRSAK